MMTTATQLAEAVIYWNANSFTDEGWKYRIRLADGTDESGEWSWDMPNTSASSIANAVCNLAHQYGETITADDVAVEDLCGTWTRTA